ncbi:MAG: adenylate/guanylate cyclase domain-containing protein [Gaiellaceae bacterium]
MRGDLPSGTVTFLFTDIEGSTRLLEHHSDRYADLLEEHRRVLRGAFERHGGVEVDTQGDAFFVAFACASDALAAAEDAQRALELPVRIGIHTGEPQLRDGGYVGIDVHRAARICGVGHGGQVLVSERSASLLDCDASLIDLGLHRLKDLGEPVKLYQLGEDEFPPLRSLNATNLPAQPSPLIGRERELTELRSIVLDGARLVTLSGPGGSGKTRLSLQVAAELVDNFSDGVFWVSLAALRDPELVIPTVEQTVGAKVPLAQHLDEKKMLLLLDNLEQVAECAADIGTLLESCPNLKLLVTSRVLLKIQGEREYQVLPLPEDQAIALFRARAAVAEPEAAVAEICRRLDGLPLAIELAAARTRVLPPARMLERLEQRLPLLTGGVRNAPERQRTLRATIEWSYDLLGDGERRLFARLAIFAGSFALEAAERVCGAQLETLESLVEKSLVRATSEGRFFMLETIHEFAAELLEKSGEADELARAHAEWTLDLAESAGVYYNEAEGSQEYELVVSEQANLRAASDWALRSDPELGLRLVVALEMLWTISDPRDGARRVAAMLERAGEAPAELLGHGFRVLGSALNPAGDQEGAEAAYRRSLELFEEIGSEREAAVSTFRLGATASNMGDVAKARPLLEESLARLRAVGDTRVEPQVVGVLGFVAAQEGDLAQARALMTESATRAAEVGFSWWQNVMLSGLAEIDLEADDYDAAEQSASEILRMARRMGERQQTVYCLALLACVASGRGQSGRAARLWGALEAEEAKGPVGAWEPERAKFRALVGDLDHEALTEGRRLALEDAVEYALTDDA